MEQEENLNSKELSLVVLGGIESGKTTLIQSLLGQTDTQRRQRTANCIRHHGQLSNRKLTVVDTPGWWNGYPLIDTAQRTKDELVLSARECPPGPHAFILTIEFAGFTERNLRAVIEHLSLFGDDIWRHTIVVFTRGDSLECIEQHIESEGTALKGLVEKCGKRYCVFDKQTTGQGQFIELLEVIESLVDSNDGRHFQMNEETLREVDERKREAQQRARERQLQVHEKRKHLKHNAGVIPSLPDVRIVMLGWVMSGKTSARNVILNKDIGASLNKTERCERETGSVGGRKITVVDTPGWWKYFSAQYIPGSVETELKESVSLGSKSPHALLLVVPAGESFLEEQRKITEDNMKTMFGRMASMVWRHTIVLFNLWDSLGNTSIEEHIETEGEHLRWLVEKCGNRYHTLDIINRGDGSQVRELLEKIDELEASLDFCDQSQEGPNTEITPNYEEEDQLMPEMLKLVGKEWSRRDKVLEERVKRLWQETFGAAWRGDGSMGLGPDFHENDVSSDKGVEKKLSVDLPQGKSSDLKYTSEHSKQPHGLPHLHPSALNEKMRVKFEREWGRCKAINADRIRGILFHGSAEDQPHKHGSRELEEWACHEAIVMERVQAIISELCSQAVFMSEPDDEERKQAEQKVMMWKTHTSGLGTESDMDDNEVEHWNLE